jgi:50S ribosomal subunit-associated GTPase HflX
MLFNKADRLSSEQTSALRVEFPDCAVVSALTKAGLDELRAELFGRTAKRVRHADGRPRRPVAMTRPLD